MRTLFGMPRKNVDSNTKVIHHPGIFLHHAFDFFSWNMISFNISNKSFPNVPSLGHYWCIKLYLFSNLWETTICIQKTVLLRLVFYESWRYFKAILMNQNTFIIMTSFQSNRFTEDCLMHKPIHMQHLVFCLTF